jgi:hypothetical protein
MQCQCGAVMTRFQFPMYTNEAKAKWLDVTPKQAVAAPDLVQFEGMRCQGCGRTTGDVRDETGTSIIKVDPDTGEVSYTPCAPRGKPLDEKYKKFARREQRKAEQRYDVVRQQQSLEL